MSAPTEERGRQGAVPTEQSYAVQAREKKVEIAWKASADGLKSRIKTPEERLKALKSAEKLGPVTEEVCNRGRFLVCDSQTRKRPLFFYAFARWRFCSGWGGLSSLGEISPALVRAILVSMGPTSS